MKKFLASLLLMVCLMPFALRADEVESRFFYDFNDSSIAGWKTVDVDNDGYCWLISGEGYIYSESSEYLKPYNVFSTTSKYAIYPTSKITFDVKPLDAEKVVEKYGIGIAYSLDGVSFISLQDETTLASATEWNKVEISLEYLANQEVYIGILHYTMDDQGTILVDNIKLTDGLLTPVDNLAATEGEDNVSLSWTWEDEDSKEPLGYRVYRKRNNGSTEVIAENVTGTSYEDAQWNELEWGIYQWGVAALYEATTRGTAEDETLLEEGFETSQYPYLPEGWTTFSDPATANSIGLWSASGAVGVALAPDSGEQMAFSYGGYAKADYYLVTPAIDLTKAVNPTLEFNYASPEFGGETGDPLYVKFSESAEGPWTELWTETSNFQWKKASVDISACAGKTVYIAFVHEDLRKNFGTGVDNISIKAQTSETSVPVASKTVWSNVIEKNMNTTVNFTVATDNNASAEGAVITLNNTDETQYKYEATADATGVYQFTEVRRGSYEYTVTLEGYYPANGTVEAYEEVTTGCILEKMPESIEGLYVSPTAWAMWEYENANATFYILLNDKVVEENYTGKNYQFDVESLVEGQEYKTTILPNDQNVMLEYTWKYASCRDFANAVNFKVNKAEDNKAVLTWDMPTFEQPLEPEYDFSVNFDNGTLEGWTTIDGDGDLRNWQNTAEFAIEGFGVNNTYCAASLSYETELDKAIDPNNFLVSGRKYTITTGSKLTYQVSAQSKYAPNEHYGVAISMKSNTDANDFTVIFDETLEAGEVEDFITQGQWFERTVDLSEYAGQEIYIAFRHYNSKNNSWIKVDDISLTSGTTRGNREEGEWLYYDNGVYESSLGLFDYSTSPASPTQIFWAIMFPADVISDYAKRPITKIALYDYEAHNGAFSIHKGGDTAPGTMVHVQTYTTTGKKSYVEIELDTPVTISGNENIWIQFSNEYGSGGYVAAYSADMGDPNSRWMSQDGASWFDANWFGESDNGEKWYGTWMIRAFVGEKDESIVDEPESTTFEPLGTIVYRNGELITPEPIKENTFTDTFTENEDEVEYTIRVVYGGIKDQTYYAMSCPLTKTLVIKEPLSCVRPQNLYGETTMKEDGTFGATLIWPYVKEWLYYDNGTPAKTFGYGGQIHWGIMFPAKDLAQYAGTKLTKVALYNKVAGDATLTISYGGDFAPERTVYSQDFTFAGPEEEGIFEVKLTEPVDVSGDENIWVTIYQSGADYPAVATTNTGDPNGRWISSDGKTWNDLLALNPEFDYTWFLRAYVSTEITRDNGDFDHYNIYRSTSNDNYQLIGETEANNYFDEVDRGTYYYQVTSVYSRGDETCESEPATAYGETGKDYVVVEVTKIDENGVKGMMVYPNPAKDMLNITAENMRRITISNVLGQVVYDQNVNSDNEIINMSQYEAGIYMVRIATENGVAVKRISVTK